MKITAYHGTPHNVQRFSVDHIGSGEGAQAYGWGLYFAESKGVAHFYKDSLSNYNKAIDESGLNDEAKKYTRMAFEAHVDNKKGALSFLSLLYHGKESLIRELNGGVIPEDRLPELQNLSAALLKTEELYKSANLYEVEISIKNDEFLLWDQPYSMQSEKIRKIVDMLDIPDKRMTGKEIYSFAKEIKGLEGGLDRSSSYPAEWNEFSRAASEFLYEIGVKGIKYLDGFSRENEHGNYNYVVFNDADVSITSNLTKVTAYHGTPHAVDRFSTKHIGSGEGAQVYGWGLYFAQDKEIAKWYKDKLGRVRQIDGEEFDENNPFHVAKKTITDHMGQRKMAITELRRQAKYAQSNEQKRFLNNAADFLKDKLDLDANLTNHYTGNLYEVEISIENDETLLWDAPFSAQSQRVKDMLKPNPADPKKPFITERNGLPFLGGIYDPSGRVIYDAFLHYLSDDQQTSLYFLDHDVKGVKYLDGMSRDSLGNGENYNYVVFDDSLITIKKNLTKTIAYHGTPHDVDAFSLQHIGAGEGNQAYGWGLYFAASVEAAKYYQDKLSNQDLLLDGISAGEYMSRTSNPIFSHVSIYHNDGLNKEQILEKLSADREYEKMRNNRFFSDRQYAEVISVISEAIRLERENKGNLYRVEINATDEDFLDFNLPFSEQTWTVKRAIKEAEKKYGSHAISVMEDNDKGEVIYRHFANFERNCNRKEVVDLFDGNEERAVSEHLYTLGVKGIKYLGNSGAVNSEDRDYNYVIFNDKDISIVENLATINLIAEIDLKNLEVTNEENVSYFTAIENSSDNLLYGSGIHQ